MSFPKCKNVEVINNPARPRLNHKEANYNNNNDDDDNNNNNNNNNKRTLRCKINVRIKQ